MTGRRALIVSGLLMLAITLGLWGFGCYMLWPMSLGWLRCLMISIGCAWLLCAPAFFLAEGLRR